MPTAEVKRSLVSVYHLVPQVSEAFFVFLVAGGQLLVSVFSWSIWTVYALSLSLSACFLRTRFLLSFAKDTRLFLNAAAYSLCPSLTSTANFWAQIIFDPYRRPLTLTFPLVSKRGFSRIWCSTVCITARYPRMLQKL